MRREENCAAAIIYVYSIMYFFLNKLSTLQTDKMII